MAINKVIYGGSTLIDLTQDTVSASDVLSGKTFHLASGDTATGACTFDSDTSNDTALIAEVLSGKTFHARGTALEGTMTNNGSVSGTISSKDGVYTVPQGFHDGSGTVQISSVEQAKIIAANIKSGVSILGVSGSYSGEAVTAQSKTATPSTTQQTILPDTGYDYLSQVTVAAIPYTESSNSAGGTTVTIG